MLRTQTATAPLKMSPSETTDEATIRQIRSGDAEALSAWFQRHKDVVYSFVYYRVGNDAELAADATQATFATALDRLEDFDPARGSMANWLRWLSRNVVRDLLKQHKGGVSLQAVWDRIDRSLEEAFERIDQQLMPDEVLEREETRELVGMALANLPPQYQSVLQAKYVENQSLDVIAQARDATIDSVKSMLRRARAAFKECFLAIAET